MLCTENIKNCTDINVSQDIMTEIKQRSHTDFSRCFQCFSCSGGCPFTMAMDYGPNKIMRLLQLGLFNEALQSTTIWICVGCDTCSTQCPMAIDIAAVMDVLREKALESGIEIPNQEILDLHEEVLNSIRSYGRTHKLEIMLRYKVRKKAWLEDMNVGIKMLAKRKLDLWPSKIQSKEDMQKILPSKKNNKGYHE